MSGHIFLLQDGGGLVRMKESPYDSEALLQELLAKYPDLLAGDQIDGAEPRRWLLVSREMGVPGEEDGSDRWSLDHLFLDQEAIPTLVEVKRSSDTRIRREVVGQMLDYAANAVVYWPVETIRARFEKTCEAQGTDPATALAEFLGGAGDGEAFWQNAKTNLQAGRVRLVFVADVIPPELRRVVEFLNGQMDPAEVLAVEVKQFVGEGKLTTLVPRLVGQTAVAQQKKVGGTPKQQKTDEASYLAEMLQQRGAEECQVARRLVEWAKEQKLEMNFNRAQQSSSFIPVARAAGGPRYPISVSTVGSLWVQMRWLRESAPFRDEAKREELRAKLNAIPGVSVEAARMTGYPTLSLKALVADGALRTCLDVLTWVVDELRAVETAHQSGLGNPT